MPINPNQTKNEIDSGSTTTYLGEAPKGTATSDAKWTITKIVKASNLVAITSTGTTAVWDDRITENYA